ncbi:SCO7613 C-terminal domain-containing membrane protein [Microbacterium sp. ZW T5_56]|uniref:SCO7613 C-terminal domain-containing membrane protein n=1 Tax=Microbacterium sp. ZW T5_56 TaxID=3378081 RepID=UPI003851C5EB
MIPDVRAGAAWTERTIAKLSDRRTCPLCLAGVVREGVCLACTADLRGARGAELWRITAASIDALSARRRWLATIPTSHADAVASSSVGQAAAVTTPALEGAVSRGDSITIPAMATAPAAAGHTTIGSNINSGARRPSPPVAPTPGRAAMNPPRPSAPRSSASLQSVLAVAGAGLFAVAAVVFSFFNADLSSPWQRLPILGGIAAAFLVLAWALSRRRLAFSAEAIGALGLVFVALSIASVAQPVTYPWIAAAAGTAVAAPAAIILGHRIRLRSWLWMGLMGASLVPAMVGWAALGGAGQVLGHILAAATACALIDLIRRLAPRFEAPLTAERRALTAVQLVIGATVLPLAPFAGRDFPALTDSAALWVPVAVTAGALGLIARASVAHPLPRWWSFSSGALLTGSLVFGALAFAPSEDDAVIAMTATGAALALVMIGVLLPMPRATNRTLFLGGIIAVAAWPAMLALVLAFRVGALTIGEVLIPGWTNDAVSTAATIAAAIALLIMAAGVALFGRLDAGRTPGAATIARPLAVALTGSASLVIACLPVLRPTGTVIVALIIVGALALLERTRWMATRHRTDPTRIVTALGAHVALVLAAVVSWSSLESGTTFGLAVIAAIAASATLIAPSVRFLHVGACYAYALVVIAVGLHLLRLDDIVVLCVTSAIGSLGAVAATFLPRPRSRSWTAILAVTAVPYLLGVVQVFFERSGWTALTTGAMFALTLTLVLTRHRPVSTPIRGAAAFLLVPTLAVMTTCLCAQLPASGSPVALPIIAVLVSLTLASGSTIEDVLIARRLPATSIGVSRWAIEASALLTGGLAVLLALWRVAAGLPTASLVLLILAIGAAGAAIWSHRPYGWWLAGASATGALWCVWGLIGVEELEPYLLPPTITAVLVALWLAARGRRATALYGAGLALAVLPILVVLAIRGTPGDGPIPWRSWALIATAWVLAAAALFLFRRSAHWRALTVPTLGIAIIAATAAVVQSVRWGVGLDPLHIAFPPLFAGLIIGTVAAVPAAAAARTLPRRWRGAALLAPVVIVLASAWPLMGRDDISMWTMWTAMIMTLALMLGVSVLLRRGVRHLPPIPALFLLAFVTSIVAWSTRELRVEWFSLPLGLFLLAAGLVFRDRIAPAAPGRGLAPRITDQKRLLAWPLGATGSWPILGPGAAITVLASIIATFTDPQTWRAILVIVLALIGILWGARAKLRAPFLIGVIVLPVENVFVFAVQFGRGIESMPWWITLAVVGAVLLILAVTYERREGEDAGITARLRDLH